MSDDVEAAICDVANVLSKSLLPDENGPDNIASNLETIAQLAWRFLDHDSSHDCVVTVRDRFAAVALGAFLNDEDISADPSFTSEKIAKFSYDIADAMLKAREE